MSIVIALALLQAATAEPDAVLYGRAGNWPVFQNGQSCSTLVQYERGDIFHLDVSANRDRAVLTLSNTAWSSIRDGERIQIEFQIDNFDTWDASAIGFNDASERGFSFTTSGAELLTQLAVGNGIHVRRNGRPVADLSMRGSAAAMRMIGACLDDLRSSANYDPFDDGTRPAPVPSPSPTTSVVSSTPPPPRRPTLVEMLAERPRGAIPMNVPALWLSQDDYPNDSIDQGEFGLVRYRLTVKENGRVKECQVTQSSGFERLDERVCDRIEGRAQFAPALDASGVALEGVYESEFRWILPIGIRR